MGFCVVEDGLDELVGLYGGFALALFALADGLGDGLEHSEGGMGAGLAPGWVFVAFDEFLEVAGVDWTVYVF